jgi:hypothetical protein
MATETNPDIIILLMFIVIKELYTLSRPKEQKERKVNMHAFLLEFFKVVMLLQSLERFSEHS